METILSVLGYFGGKRLDLKHAILMACVLVDLRVLITGLDFDD